MQTQVLGSTKTGTQVVGWLHRSHTKARTCVVLVHGHNSHAGAPWYITLAKELERLGVDCLRYSVTRKELAANTLEVTTVTEEVTQAKAIVAAIRSKYTYVVAAGHSQGGIIALQLAVDGFVDGVVQLMAVADTTYHVRSKLAMVGMDLDQLRSKEFVPYLSKSQGTYFGYTAAFFDDFSHWDVPGLLRKNHKPILFVEARSDDKLEPGEVKRAFVAASTPKELFTVDGRHNFSNENALVIARKIHEWLAANKLQ